MSRAPRRWVKIWHEILADQKFQDLPLDQQARFYHLLVYTSAQGKGGTLRVEQPDLCKVPDVDPAEARGVCAPNN